MPATQDGDTGFFKDAGRKDTTDDYRAFNQHDARKGAGPCLV